jgi:hypothetical protein
MNASIFPREPCITLDTQRALLKTVCRFHPTSIFSCHQSVLPSIEHLQVSHEE